MTYAAGSLGRKLIRRAVRLRGARRVGSWAIPLALLLLFCSSAYGAERPVKPKSISPYASPVSAVRSWQGMTEGAAFLARLPQKMRKKLHANGRVLLPQKKTKGKGFGGYIRAVTLFKQPKNKVYDLILRFDEQALYLPRLVFSKSVTRDATGDLVHFRLKALFLSVDFWTQHWMWPQYSRIEWQLAPGYEHDIDRAEGFWQLYALSSSETIASYGTKVDTGINVPEKIQNFFARRDVPKALDAFVRYINSGGSWRK